MGFIGVYALVMVPVFAVVSVVLAFSIRREARVLREHLAADLREGRLSKQEYDDICSSSWGLRRAWQWITLPTSGRAR